MKKIILSFALVTLMSIGATAQSDATSEVKTETKKKCSKKGMSCCKKKAASANGNTAATTGTKACCKNKSGKSCDKAKENTSSK